ncbi:MAG: TetR/AcrR family transcriptional regulator [Dehalococcoidia bacterium]|nr:TetR/AcrR family transcriptional regulator [Dehalococcoidia bacterium]
MPAPKPLKQLRAQRTHRDLLAAARRVFAERGYEGATIDDIAQAAGCSKGAYYFHFASKEEALLALLDDWTAATSRRLKTAAGGSKSPHEALRRVLEALYSPETTTGVEPRLLLEFWSQAERTVEVRRRLAKAQRTWRRLLAEAFRRAQEPGLAGHDFSAASAADTALALREGFVAQACLAAPTRASARERAAAAAALFTNPRALRRAG